MTDEQIQHNAIICVHSQSKSLYHGFCVYNPCNYGFNNERPSCTEIELPNTDFYRKIKSFTWSCNVRFFCIVDNDSIVVGNTNNNKALICNPTWRVFEELLNGIKQ